MLCVRDVTELKRLEAEASVRKRELQMIGEILAITQEEFQTFLDSARGFVEENRCLLEAPSTEREGTVQHLFRNMHTIKGNARTFGLLELTNLVHATEQGYETLRRSPQAVWNRGQLLGELTAVRTLLDTYGHVNDTVLGRKGPGRRGDAERFLMVDRSWVQQGLSALLGVEHSDPNALRSAFRHVTQMLYAIGTETPAALLATTLESLPSLARELGKEPPVVEIHDHDLSIRTQVSGLLRDVFTHLFRNAIDHGIESAADRREQGKTASRSHPAASGMLLR
jgi:chemotaxis protein histidine kinase CheA